MRYVKSIKSLLNIWERYPNYLRKHFWKGHTFWTDGYFACSAGNVSEEMLRKYIENQGCKTSGGRFAPTGAERRWKGGDGKC